MLFFWGFSLNGRGSCFCGLIAVLPQHAKLVSKISWEKNFESDIPVKSEFDLERDCPGMCRYCEFCHFLGLFALRSSTLIRFAAFGHSESFP